MASQLIGGAWKGVRLAKSNGSPSTAAQNEGEPEPPANGSDDEAIGRNSETDDDTDRVTSKTLRNVRTEDTMSIVD